LNNLHEEPLKGEIVYLFGNMNDWGKNWDSSSRFEYKGNGIYETTTKLKKGTYEFKIAQGNWKFDFGTEPNQEKVTLGTEVSLIKKDGSDNVKIELLEEKELIFHLNLSNEKTATLIIK
jgi:hypothetical protein